MEQSTGGLVQRLKIQRLINYSNGTNLGFFIGPKLLGESSEIQRESLLFLLSGSRFLRQEF